jgi:hypothetical protein
MSRLPRTAAWASISQERTRSIIEPKLIEYSFGDRKAQVEFTPGQTGVKVSGEIEELVEGAQSS